MVGSGSAERRTAGATSPGMDSAVAADIAGVSPSEAASGAAEGVCAGDEGVFAGGGGGFGDGGSVGRVTLSRRAHVATAGVMGALLAFADLGFVTRIERQCSY